MMRMINCLAAVAMLMLSGCSAVYFYETDKISLTVEARPDMTGPIQGNFGLKQRVVAFVPPRNRSAVSKGQSNYVAELLQKAERYSMAAKAAMSEQTKDEAKPSSTIALAIDTLQQAKATPGLNTALIGEIDEAEDHLVAANARLVSATQPSPEVRQNVANDLGSSVTVLRKAKGAARSDAMSVLSSLRFHKLPKPDGAPFWKISHITVDGALITGGAAKVVAHPAEALGALSGQTSLSGVDRVVALRSVYTALKSVRGQDLRAEELIRTLDALAPSILPDRYPVNAYVRDEKGNLTTDTKKGDPTARKTFGDVLTYWGTMQDSAQILDALPGGTFQVDGQAITNDRRAELSRDGEAAKAEASRIEAQIKGQREVKEAVAYFVETL